jgi:DNA-binding LacI/PurR family transcriptional regulator
MVVVSYDRGATPGQRSRVGHVMPDNFEAARMATRHLGDKGHRRLAFATVAGMTMSRGAKIAGFQHQALETVVQLAALLKGEIPPGAVNAEHATRLRKGAAS